MNLAPNVRNPSSEAEYSFFPCVQDGLFTSNQEAGFVKPLGGWLRWVMHVGFSVKTDVLPVPYDFIMLLMRRLDVASKSPGYKDGAD